MWMWGLRVEHTISRDMARLNTKINEEASWEGLFFMCYLDFFLWVVFCRWCGFYERDGNDINRRLVYWNGMGGCSVFGGGWKNEMAKFVRFFDVGEFWKDLFL